jgi:nicotinamide-nucleotide amidase
VTLPKAAILAIGSELTAGRTIDTNSAWLAKRLAELGITCVLQISCPDDMDLMIRSLEVVSSQADIVLVTGGLGPTADDFTRDAVAKFLGVELQPDQASLDYITEIFRGLGRSMSDSNKRQALFPVGADILFNNQGTAPGFLVYKDLRKTTVSIMVAPGVPREMKVMYDEQMLPRLRELLGGDSYHIAQRCLRTCSVSESKLDRMLLGVEESGVELAFAVKEAEGTITLTYTARGADKDTVEALVDEAVAESEKRLGSFICARGDETLGQTVCRLLTAKSQTMAVVEGHSGGRLCSLLTHSSAAEKVLKRGFVLPGKDHQHQFLKSPVADNGRDRALALARQLRATQEVDFGLAIIGPGPAPEAQITLAVVGPDDEVVKERALSVLAHKARHRFLTLAAAYALDILRQILEQDGDR